MSSAKADGPRVARHFQWQGFLLLLLALAACHRHHPDRARMILRNGTGTSATLWMIDPTGRTPAAPISADLGLSALAFPIDHGRALVGDVRGASGRDVVRIEVTARGLIRSALLVPNVDGLLLATSSDGSTLLVDRTHAGVRNVVAIQTRPALHESIVGAFGFIHQVALSEDGAHALVAASDASCSSNLHRCPFDLWAVDLAMGTPPRPLAIGHRAYQPRFIPGTSGARIAYQTTEFDTRPECENEINVCRHDVVTRDFAGTEPPRPLVQAAIGLSYASSGGGIGYLSYLQPETGCHALPCSTSTLYAGSAIGLAVPVIRQVALFGPRYWSPDGEWLSAGVHPTPEAPMHAVVVRSDGTARADVGEGSVVGWVVLP